MCQGLMYRREYTSIVKQIKKITVQSINTISSDKVNKLKLEQLLLKKGLGI